MNYQNFDLEIISTQGGERLYARVLESPQGDCPFVEVKWPFQPEEESQLLADIYGTLRQRRARSSKASTLQDFGSRLFDAVFVGDIEHLFRASLDAAFRVGQGLRLRLRLPEESDLHARPWEYLFDTERGEFLAVREHTPLVRYLPVAQPLAPITVQGPLRILVALSSPSDHPRLDITREWDILWKALAGSANAGHIEVRQLRGRCTFDNLRDELRSFGADIFHFVGHGVPGALVIEEEASGKGVEMEATHLRAAFRSGALPRLIVLNACSGAMAEEAPFSGLAQGFLRQGVPAVVAMQASITDDAAVIFTRYFYRDLVETGAVDAALTEARLRMQVNGHPIEWGTPVLYMRALSGQLFQPRVNQEERVRQRESAPAERESAGTYAGASPAQEQQVRDQQVRDQQLREQQVREQQAWAQRERERAAREREEEETAQQEREQHVRDQHVREQHVREQEARAQQEREQRAMEQRAREQAARQQQEKEQAVRKQQALEQQAREQKAREQKVSTQQAQEQQAQEQQAREQQASARAAAAAEARQGERKPSTFARPREDASVQSAAAGNEQKAPAGPWEGAPPRPPSGAGERKKARPAHRREDIPPARMEPNLDEQDGRAPAPAPAPEPYPKPVTTRATAQQPEARTAWPENGAAAADAVPEVTPETRRFLRHRLTLGLALATAAVLTFGGYAIFSARSKSPTAPHVIPTPVSTPVPVRTPVISEKAATPALPPIEQVARAKTGPDVANEPPSTSTTKPANKLAKTAKSATGQRTDHGKRQSPDTDRKTAPPPDKCKSAGVKNDSLDCWFPNRGGMS